MLLYLMQYLWNSAIHFTYELIYLVLMIEIIESFFVNVIMHGNNDIQHVQYSIDF